MSKRTIDTVCCEEFNRDYGTIYLALQAADRWGGVVDYGKLVKLHDKMVVDDGFWASEVDFAEFRNDFITSDRELAAFTLAMMMHDFV